jgi:cell division protein FtsW (lipid II flippase)
MTKLRRTIFFVSSVVSLAVLVFPAFAQISAIRRGACGFPGIECTGKETLGGDLLPYISFLINVIISLVAILSVAYLVVAAIQYVMSQGDHDKLERAKRQVIYALLGLILAISSWIIVTAVIFTDPITIENLAAPYINMAISLVGLAAAIYIIYAGYKYINSRGDEEAAATAKRQITFALIGVFIAGAAQIIVDVILIQDTRNLVVSIRSVINAVLTLLGLIAAAYVVLGGVSYFMSQGDQDKASRAKMQILYALLGIAVVSVSAILVNFIIANI